MGTLRTFIAFDTPDDIRIAMADLQGKLKSAGADVKWESSDKFHATIKFLGDVDESLLPEILDDIATTVRKHQSFTIAYTGIGAFPDAHHPRVIWIGCKNADGILERLKNSLDAALVPKGFDIETRRFHPHITLGRVKSVNRLHNLTPMLENLTFEPRTATIDEIMVMKSVLRPEGAAYTVLKTFQLSSH